MRKKDEDGAEDLKPNPTRIIAYASDNPTRINAYLQLQVSWKCHKALQMQL